MSIDYEVQAREWMEECAKLMGVGPAVILPEVVRFLADTFRERDRSVASEARKEALLECAREADCAALEKPQNAKQDNPRAAYRSGACRAAWRIRALAGRKEGT